MNSFMESAKIMPKGQITLPKDIRDILGLEQGDRVTFVVNGTDIRLVNSAVYAMEVFQKQMQGEAERTGLTSDEAITDLVKQIRSEDDDESSD